MSDQNPLESKSIFLRAAGYISFLRSCVRCGDSLDEQEEGGVDRMIAELRDLALGKPEEREAMKNEHLVWAYSELPGQPGRVAIFIGLTDAGLEYMREKPGWALQCNPPEGMRFPDVATVQVFSMPTKGGIHGLFQQAGMVVARRS